MYCSDGEYTDTYETHSEDEETTISEVNIIETNEIFLANNQEADDDYDSSSLFIKSEINIKKLSIDSDVATPEIKEDPPIVQLRKLNISQEKSRTLLKWRENQIKKICEKRDEMKYNTEQILINDFMKKEYEELEKKWKLKIAKSATSKPIKKNNNYKKKRENIKFIFDNMRVLEQMGVSKTQIKKYSNTQYDFIKNKYTKKNLG